MYAHATLFLNCKTSTKMFLGWLRKLRKFHNSASNS